MFRMDYTDYERILSSIGVLIKGGFRGGIWGFIPLNFLELKIIKNVKKILKLMGKTRLALTFSQEIQTETRIPNFNLKGDLVRNFFLNVKKNTKVRKNPIIVETRRRILRGGGRGGGGGGSGR